MTEPHQPKIKVPRGLRGRRARQLYRELAPLVQFRADTDALLAAYAGAVANIAGKPNSFRTTDLDRVRQLGKLLGLTKGDSK